VRLQNAKAFLSEIIDNGLSAAEAVLKHENMISNLITQQANDSIRKLLVELETGGNIRFEEEQKDATWIAHCEKLIKKLIKRAASKDSPKTIQIHKITRIHNRGDKMRFDEKVESQENFEKGNYLCFHGQSDYNDMISIAEYGLSNIFPKSRYPNGVLVTNFFDCREQIGEFCSPLRKTLIMRTCITNSMEYNNDSLSLDKTYTVPKDLDALYQNWQAGTPSSKDPEVAKYYRVFNLDSLLPEFLVEYSLESDFDSRITTSQRLLLDVAFSDRMAHANMPMIVRELIQKLDQPVLIC
jgi:hypothetical protein